MSCLKQFHTKLHQNTDIAPLVVFRIIFGCVMAISVLRFAWNGWINSLYIQPHFYFPYYGFEWIKPLGKYGMYAIFFVMFLSAVGILLGAFYRITSVLFFFAFTYVELIDKTNYLNHYYFVSIISLLMMMLPAHAHFSVDAYRNASIRRSTVPYWMLGAIKLQLGIVYFYAGIAKLNADWLFRAMPLNIWLKAQVSLPVIGGIFRYDFVAYLFSWFGAIYDLTIPFILLCKKWRFYGYVLVIIFHVMTRIMFPIGMFPYIMILSTLIFFSIDFHKKIISFLQQKITFLSNHSKILNPPLKKYSKLIYSIFVIHFFIQIIFPFRYLFYPGDLFWTEEGYRFSWRVMLIEKAGYAIFEVTDAENNRTFEINNRTYLTAQQEKMMSTQPDMILQFAHFLGDQMHQKGVHSPQVRVKSYITLNGSGSRLYIDPKVDLMQEKESFLHKDWVLPFKKDEL